MNKESILCVDLGGTKILVGELTQDGKILDYRQFPSEISSQEKALEKIEEIIGYYLGNVTVKGNLIGISLDLVGRVDSENGIWFEIEPGKSQKMELAEELSKRFDLPVVINNDVTSATLAELELGIGRKTKNFIYLNVGTGIAGRIVSEGQIVKGGNFNAGEIGHVSVEMNSDLTCSCGRSGCVESFASGRGMSDEYLRLSAEFPHALTAEAVTGESILQNFKNGDELAEKVVHHATKGIAALIMNLVRTSDPEAVILGGGIMSNSTFFKLVEEKLNPKTMRFVTLGIQQTGIDPHFIALRGCMVAGFKKFASEKGGNRGQV